MKKLLVIILLLFSFSKILSVAIYNQYDPVQFHTVYGTDKYFYDQDDKFKFSINISPYYQHSSGARDDRGIKVPEGDMFGRWNMFGLFYGIRYTGGGAAAAAPTTPNASPVGNKFDLIAIDLGGGAPAARRYIALPHNNDPTVAGDGTTTRTRYPKLSDAWRVLDDVIENVAPVVYPNAGWQYDVEGFDKNYTLESLFNFENDKKYFPYTYVDYEKLGIRGRFNFECEFGLGCNLKWGFCDYEQKPVFVRGPGFTDTNIADANEPEYYIYNYLMKPEIMKTILEDELGLSIAEVHKTELEDTHLEVYFKYPWELLDDDGDTAAILVPYLSLGVWMPTGKKKDPNKFFSIPTGNDDFWGMTIDGAINVDFPGMVQLSLGGGVAFYESKRLSDYRVPDSIYQMSIYPWKARIKKRPGAVWYVNISCTSRDFLDYFSFYFDFVHTEHLRDSITMQETAERNALFKPDKLKKDSKWRANVIHAGINYHVAPGLELGLSAQGHISGSRVYKTTTVLGTISLNF